MTKTLRKGHYRKLKPAAFMLRMSRSELRDLSEASYAKYIQTGDEYYYDLSVKYDKALKKK